MRNGRLIFEAIMADLRETLHRKLDCFILTAKLSRDTTKELQNLSRPRPNVGLSKQILAKVLQIKRTEDRVLKRLDYWIYGELRNDSARERSRTAPIASNSNEEQTWDLNIRSAISRPTESNIDQPDKSVGRSVSAVKTKTKSRKGKPWKSTNEPSESISMFDYNPSDPSAEDEAATSGENFRSRMFYKFGTLPRRKLKMFFSRGNEDEERKSVQPEKRAKTPRDDADNKSIISRYMRRNSRKESRVNVNENGTSRPPKTTTRRRPQSEASFGDFDFNKIDLATTTLPVDDDGAPPGTFRDKLRSMPLFYVPSLNKKEIKTYR